MEAEPIMLAVAMRLQEILDTMEIPKERKTDIKWLRRNIRINNSNHPDIEEAVEIMKKWGDVVTGEKIILENPDDPYIVDFFRDKDGNYRVAVEASIIPDGNAEEVQKECTRRANEILLFIENMMKGY